MALEPLEMAGFATLLSFILGQEGWQLGAAVEKDPLPAAATHKPGARRGLVWDSCWDRKAAFTNEVTPGVSFLDSSAVVKLTNVQGTFSCLAM